MNNEKLKIGIILGSTRVGRVSPQVGKWVFDIARSRNDADYELIDIADYRLPLLGESTETEGIIKWNEKLSSLDGFIFIVCEYNHSISAALKNALDLARDPWFNKAAGIVSYGSSGGARATEHLRGILAELRVATVRTHPTLSTFYDFENSTIFKPQALHQDIVKQMIAQLLAWAKALKTLR